MKNSTKLHYIRSETSIIFFQIQHQDIIVQLPCPVPNGTQILYNYGYLDSQNNVMNYDNTPLALAIFYIAFFFLTIFAFVVNFGHSKKIKQRKGNISWSTFLNYFICNFWYIEYIVQIFISDFSYLMINKLYLTYGNLLQEIPLNYLLLI